MYQGYDIDSSRHGYPVHDGEAEANHTNLFGSAHAGGVNMALCDGSVETFDYEIDETLWGNYVNREDGNVFVE